MGMLKGVYRYICWVVIHLYQKMPSYS